MDERACRRGTCGRSGVLTRVISQTGPGSLAHDRQFGVNAQCLGPAACTCVRAWLSGGVPVPAPQEDVAGRPTSQPTRGQTNNSHETRSSIHGGHERVRMLLPAFAGSKHPEKSTMPEGIGACGNAPTQARCGPRGHVRSRKCLLLGMFVRAAQWCGAGGGDGRWITRRGRRAGRCDSSDYV
jgi:hypothetical protein